MPSKQGKARRKEVAHSLRDQQRQKVRESFPIPLTELKERFDFLDSQLSGADCDDTLRFTREFMKARAIDESRVIPWLEDNGGHCDCEILNNVEDVVVDAIPGFDE